MINIHPYYNFLYIVDTKENQKKISIKYKNYFIQTNICNVIILNQNQFKIKPLNQIGHKTSLIWKEPELPKINFEKEYFLQGLAYFHGLSPDENEIVGYLYKFPTKLAKNLEIFLNNDLNLNIKIQYNKGFKFFSVPKNFKINFKKLGKISCFINFLAGLILAFGKFDIRKDNLLTIKINLPNSYNLVSQNEKLINLFEKLFLKQLFINYQKIDKFLNITIHDRQILENITNLLKPVTGILNIPKKDKNKILVEKLKEKFNINKNLKLKIW